MFPLLNLNEQVNADCENDVNGHRSGVFIINLTHSAQLFVFTDYFRLKLSEKKNSLILRKLKNQHFDPELFLLGLISNRPSLEAYSLPCQTSKIELFAKIVKAGSR